MTSRRSRKNDSRQMELNLPTLSPEAYHANRLVSQENKKERVTTDISGQRCFESSRHSNRGSLLSRTCEALLTSKTAWSSKLCTLIWKVKTTKHKRLLYQLQASVPRTAETASGSSRIWPTPSRGMWKQDVNDEGRYARDIKEKGYQIMLPAAVKLREQKMWPTPRSRDWKDSGKAVVNSNRKELPVKVATDNKEKWIKAGGTLNPTWVEWLMGYPAEYTDLKDWAMLYARKSRKKSAEQS